MDQFLSGGYANKAKEDLLDALESETPRGALHRVMAGMLEHGLERDEILSILDEVRHWLVETGREDDEALVAELLDGLNGWCKI